MKLKKRFGVVLLMAMLVMAMTVTASAAAKLNKTSVTVGNGQGFNLKVKGAKGQEVKWSSSNRNVATVEEGAVTTLKGGKATIRAKVGKKTLKCKVTVESIELAGVEGVALSGSVNTGSVSANVGNDTKINDYLKGTVSVDLKPYVKTYPNTLEAAWSTSNAKVATVENGVVKAVANGTTKVSLTSKDGKVAASVVVEVYNMGNDDEDANPVVITTANYDRLWNKYFGKAKVSEVFLDDSGNLLNPEKFDGTIGLQMNWKFTTKDKDGKDVEKTEENKNRWVNDYDSGKKYSCYTDVYLFYIKDQRVDALRTDGYGDFRYWVNKNTVTVKGGVPVLTTTGRHVYQESGNFNGFARESVYDSNWNWIDYISLTQDGVGRNGSGRNGFGFLRVPEQMSESFSYYTASLNVNNPTTKTTTKHTGTRKVIVSDPTIAGKTVLGFVYGGVKAAINANVNTSVDVTMKDEGTVKDLNGTPVEVKTYTYTMDSFEGETFKTLQVNLYLNK